MATFRQISLLVQGMRIKLNRRFRYVAPLRVKWLSLPLCWLDRRQFGLKFSTITVRFGWLKAMKFLINLYDLSNFNILLVLKKMIYLEL